MSEVGSLKAVEVLLLLAAGVGVVWWQLRDVSRSQQQSRAEREKREKREKHEKRQAESERPEHQREPEPPP